MGDVIHLLPGMAEIRNELTALHRLHGSLSSHNLIILTPEGVDVTDQEAENLGLVIRLLEKGLGPIADG